MRNLSDYIRQPVATGSEIARHGTRPVPLAASPSEEDHCATHDQSCNAQKWRNKNLMMMGGANLQSSHVDRLLVGCVGEPAIEQRCNSKNDQYHSGHLHRDLAIFFIGFAAFNNSIWDDLLVETNWPASILYPWCTIDPLHGRNKMAPARLSI
jgi:hypothetical protein